HEIDKTNVTDNSFGFDLFITTNESSILAALRFISVNIRGLRTRFDAQFGTATPSVVPDDEDSHDEDDDEDKDEDDDDDGDEE
ncbi:hypothetical protein Dimus_005814, partial [Dionaea muscipula]